MRTTSASGLPASTTAKVCCPRSICKLLVKDRRRRIGHIAHAGGNPLPHRLGRRVEPNPGEGGTGPRGNLGDGVTFLLLGVHRIDDDRVPTLKRHEGPFAAHRIDDVGDLRGYTPSAEAAPRR